MLYACVRLFYSVLDISIKSSFLILAILIVRKVFGEKIGAKNQYYLWILLIIRLVMPNVPNSSFSFFNMFAKPKVSSILKKHYYIYDQKDIVDWLSTSSNLMSSNTQLFSLEYIIPIVWVLGIVALTTYMILSNIRFKNAVYSCKIEAGEEINMMLREYKKKFNITKALEIYKSTIINSPCLYGLFRPSIFIPEDIEERIDKDEMKFIISHELAHFKRKDILLYLVIYMLQIIYWFNPVILYGLSRMRNDCEAACDAKVLSLFERDERKEYGLSIIHFLEKSKKSLDVVLTTEFVNTKHHLKGRIKMIKSFKKNSYKVSFITVLVLVLIGGLFLTNANSESYKSEEAPEESIEQTSLNINDENAAEEKISYEKMVWPVPSSNKITAPFGKRIHPIKKIEKMHTGIDIPAELGESIIASADGKIIFSGEEGGYGKTIIIDHGNGFATMYAHCSELLMQKDEEVSSGTQIAKIGKTGLSTATHLHFEVRKDGEVVNPLDYVNNKQ
ncbi:M56 family metallopeptidase [Brassicibacter mesophilus]|uniref:M56 family metallopeptidase n=1 Tax=Brassicibacter mesophilus TaxID=745119 RepID=UPI003D19D9BD